MEGSVNSSGVGEADNGEGEVGAVVGKDSVGREIGVAVGIALCVPANAVLTVDMAVSIVSAALVLGVDMKLLQDASVAARKKGIIVLAKIFIFHLPLMFCFQIHRRSFPHQQRHHSTDLV